MSGYLFIASDIVVFRRRYPRLNDARKAKEAQLNQQLDSQGFGAAFMSYRIGPILVCEQGARLRQLDLDVAGADARYGWETGAAGLRSADCYPCFGQICDALATLADNQIVHRDVKPQNIVVRQDGSPVLVDFGLAVDLEFAGDVPADVSGTPYFMAPEAFSNAKPDPAWDAYSLGVTAGFVLCGEQNASSDLGVMQLDKQSGAFDGRLAASVTGLPDDLRSWITDLIGPETARRTAALATGKERTAR